MAIQWVNVGALKWRSKLHKGSDFEAKIEEINGATCTHLMLPNAPGSESA
ncbi:hypothetical protein [Teredinibacter turnerae]|uniref:Uncharacterized protein n=1 Tax=Teredinibacter turnerae (strain ATCC 39867 / T7901) TaxID=377629 RepID=C5BKK3_TERTT|nr:hypothetical protein [Teredinibacter turnerae]ACR12490.1 hypothetical protein TERTU_4725 [Teredinibacter turnerae T7901]